MLRCAIAMSTPSESRARTLLASRVQLLTRRLTLRISLRVRAAAHNLTYTPLPCRYEKTILGLHAQKVDERQEFGESLSQAQHSIA